MIWRYKIDLMIENEKLKGEVKRGKGGGRGVNKLGLVGFGQIHDLTQSNLNGLVSVSFLRKK